MQQVTGPKGPWSEGHHYAVVLCLSTEYAHKLLPAQKYSKLYFLWKKCDTVSLCGSSQCVKWRKPHEFLDNKKVYYIIRYTNFY